MNEQRASFCPFVKQPNIGVSQNQRNYEAYHSPEQRKLRQAEMEATRDNAVTAALDLYNSGDHDGARDTLRSAGIDWDGVELYLSFWQ